MTVSQNRQRQGRLLVLIIALVSVIPFGTAWYYAQHPELVEKTSNYGTLVTPVRTLDRDLLLSSHIPGVPGDLEQLRGRWLWVQIARKPCTDACAESLHKTHQEWLMLNKEMSRVRRLLLVSPDAATLASVAALKDETLLVGELKPSLLAELTAAVGTAPDDGVVILIDPQANLVLWYGKGFDPYLMVKDIKHLLKVSQIG